jgi:glycosyltransferase involved in cell wall biosynthesis
MRLLWLTPEAPEPGGAGGAIRSYEQVRGLAERGVEITVVAPAYPGQARRAGPLATAGVDVALVPRPARQPVEALRALARRPALAASALRDPWLGWQAAVFWQALAPVVRARLASRAYDAAVIEHDFAVAWAERLPAELPAGLVFHNATWAYHRDRGHRLEAARFRAHVRHHARRCSRAWAVSAGDAAEVGALVPGLPVDVVPNGVDAARLGRLPPAGGDDGRVLFTGTLSYAPNADGILWFARECWPRIRAARPDTSLAVVGREPPPAVARLAREPGIEVTGWVESLEPQLAAAQVAVAPLRSGGGTKLKVLEALGAGRPLVATPVAAAGIDVADGEHLLVRDDPAAFADAVLALLGDPARRTALAVAGRERVAARYDWPVLAGAMHESLARWLG